MIKSEKKINSKKKGGKRLVRMGLVGLVFQILTTTSSRKCGQPTFMGTNPILTPFFQHKKPKNKNYMTSKHSFLVLKQLLICLKNQNQPKFKNIFLSLNLPSQIIGKLNKLQWNFSHRIELIDNKINPFSWSKSMST